MEDIGSILPALTDQTIAVRRSNKTGRIQQQGYPCCFRWLFVKKRSKYKN